MHATARPQFDITTEVLGRRSPHAPTLVVAVPVKDEVERIGLCLDALASQEEVEPSDLAVVLMLNNTTDGTADLVRELAPHAAFAIHLCQVELDATHANAGWARRLAMDTAADLAAPGALLLTTDADTLVNGDWIAANRREIAKGVDAVAGYVMADPMELMQLGAAILDRGHLEWQYQQLAAELVARVDQEAHDPWPRHNQNCGASAAITLDAYRRIGGLPPKPVGEDRALFEKVREVDGRVRHSLDVQVVTSARTDGRACGGLGDELRLRTDPDHPCDDALEVAMATLRRAQWRCEFRHAWNAGKVDAAAWGRRLRMPELEIRAACVRSHFGEVWAEVEARSPRLRRRLVTSNGLKGELRRMRKLVAAIRSREQAVAPAARRAAFA
ncbi:MAG: glycosyltransferase [Caulobacteraceae bacterium]|nr:glycosyltransferase [Caulobacter sp.]